MNGEALRRSRSASSDVCIIGNGSVTTAGAPQSEPERQIAAPSPQRISDHQNPWCHARPGSVMTPAQERHPKLGILGVWLAPNIGPVPAPPSVRCTAAMTLAFEPELPRHYPCKSYRGRGNDSVKIPSICAFSTLRCMLISFPATASWPDPPLPPSMRATSALGAPGDVPALAAIHLPLFEQHLAAPLWPRHCIHIAAGLERDSCTPTSRFPV